MTATNIAIDRRRRAGSRILLAVAAATCLLPAAAHADATFLNTWGSLGTGNGQFNDPTGVAVGPTGTVYVVDYGNENVQAFDPSGAYLSQFGTGGSGNGQFSHPFGVAVGPTGTVYVADGFNERVEAFNSSGVYQSQFGTGGSGNGQFSSPLAVAVGPSGIVYVVDYNNRVQAFNSSGAYQSQFGNGQFAYAAGVAVAPTGTIYVADSGNNRVEAFNSSGAYQSQFGTNGYGNGQFNDPVGVAVGPTGMTYVSDYVNDYVQIFNSSGAYQSQFGTGGNGNGQLYNPNGVAVTSTGMIYVADSGNYRVQRFFDPNSWTTGTNTFTDATSGPTTVAVGGATPLLGTSLTLASSMGLTANVVNINSGGSITMSGGTLSANTLSLNSGGAFSALSYTIAAGQTLNQSGGGLSISNLTVAGTYNYSAGTVSTPSSIVVNPGGDFNAPGLVLVATNSQTMTVSGGQFYLTELAATNGGILQAAQGGQFYVNAGSNSGLGIYSGSEALLDGGTQMTCGTVAISGGLLVVGNATLSVQALGGNQPMRIFSGEVQLENANTSILQTPQLLVEGGLLDGSGRINGQLQNFSGAQTSVATGQNLAITGAGSTNDGLISLTGGTLHFTQDLTNESDGSVEGYGTLRVDGGLTNSGTLALAGSVNVFGAVTNNSGGVIHLSGTSSNIFFGPVANSGTLTVDIGASGILYGAYSGAGSLVNYGSLFINANSVSGAITGNGHLTIGAGAAPSVVAAIAPGSGVSTVASVSIGSGKLDLTNNDLVVHNASSTAATAELTQITSQIKEGYNGGSWTGIGITSSSAATTPTVTALAVELNNNGSGGTFFSNFDSQPVTNTDVLVKYTFVGDADLSGTVSSADYLLVDNGFNSQTGATPLTGWRNGDFNYDGHINGDDYTLIDNAFNSQGSTSYAATSAGPAEMLAADTDQIAAVSTTAIPEPAGLALLNLTGLVYMRPKRRSYR